MKKLSQDPVDNSAPSARSNARPRVKAKAPVKDPVATNPVAEAKINVTTIKGKRESGKLGKISVEKYEGKNTEEIGVMLSHLKEKVENSANLLEAMANDFFEPAITPANASAPVERAPRKRRARSVENSLEARLLPSVGRSAPRSSTSDVVRVVEASAAITEDHDKKVERTPSLRDKFFDFFSKRNETPIEQATLINAALPTRPSLEVPPEPESADRLNVIPDAIKKRFLKVEHDYFFPDKTPAFSDRGSKLSTKSEHHEVIRSLVLIAQARGWNSVTVRGTKQFRSATWLEASMTGMNVAGYEASKVECTELAQRKALLAKTSMENSIERIPALPDTAPYLRKLPPVPPTRQPPDAVVGKLLEHGEARYQNDPKKGKSYFVTVRTKQGDKTLWGVDLARAVVQSGVVSGETISLQLQGSKAVTARERVFDENGKETGTRPVDAHKNRWLLGSLDKAEAFLTGERAQVVAQYPDLAPVYGTVAASKRFADQYFPEHSERFVAIGKKILAAKIARGENLPAPDIRERVDQKNEHLNSAQQPTLAART